MPSWFNGTDTDKHIAKYDVDHDKSITRDEFVNAMNGRILSTFFQGESAVGLRVEVQTAIGHLKVRDYERLRTEIEPVRADRDAELAKKDLEIEKLVAEVAQL